MGTSLASPERVSEKVFRIWSCVRWDGFKEEVELCSGSDSVRKQRLLCAWVS